MLLPRTEIIFK